MVSAGVMAKRALVSLLHRLALLCAVTLEVKRDSPDAEVKCAFRSVCKKSYPDRGCDKAHQQRLNSVRAVWENAQRAGDEKAAIREAKKRARAASKSQGGPVSSGTVAFREHIITHLAVDFLTSALQAHRRDESS